MRVTIDGVIYIPATEAAEGSLAIEREDTVRALRVVCSEFGDLNWSEDLHLADVIEKHLHRHLG